MSTRVTITNEGTGEQISSFVIEDEYTVVSDGSYFIDHVATYSNGTAVVTMKRNTGRTPGVIETWKGGPL